MSIITYFSTNLDTKNLIKRSTIIITKWRKVNNLEIYTVNPQTNAFCKGKIGNNSFYFTTKRKFEDKL